MNVHISYVWQKIALVAIVALLGVILVACELVTPASANYTVVVDAEWSLATNGGTEAGTPPHAPPNDMPPTLVFTPFVGAVHSTDFTLWDVSDANVPEASKARATNGLEDVAETGDPTALKAELEAADDVASVVESDATGGTADAMTGTFDINQDQVFSLVTMLAPSQDWFTGVHGLSLFVDGAWVETMTMNLVAYDAGTDSDNTFTFNDIEGDSPGDPMRLMGNLANHVPIAAVAGNTMVGLMVTDDLPNGNVIGTITFTLKK